MTSWDNNSFSRPVDPSSSMRNAPALSMSTNNFFAPSPRYSSQVHPQYSDDGRQIQQPGYQTKYTEASQATRVDFSQTSKPKSWTDHITVSHVIGFLPGLVLTAIPMGILITLYVLACKFLRVTIILSNALMNVYFTNSRASSNNTTARTESSTSATSVTLPYQCTSCSSINDMTRLSTYTAGCCPCDSAYNGWYRFTGSSGSQLITFPVNTGFCSTNAPGWWNGTHPSTVGATANGNFCANYAGYICNPSYSTASVLATNCNGFYVYYLVPLYCCCGIYPRYCTI
ncbi:unnamed protein product [Rotaria magnacalcarata]|uniref:Uncharacterized protein n=1 Tax=Rotaria magnacalcarata TaxID=392030 RepID=A0A819JED1_9BILA|nr:unnamed protein product [Rotaria magnacalcarata]CAF3928850.1 unnamed protein product [Rotaria magnacalcarata]